jgi:hypothetical protein
MRILSRPYKNVVSPCLRRYCRHVASNHIRRASGVLLLLCATRVVVVLVVVNVVSGKVVGKQ